MFSHGRTPLVWRLALTPGLLSPRHGQLDSVTDGERPPDGGVRVEPTLGCAGELEVLRLIAGGRSTVQIARELIIATSTVKTHVNSIFGKLAHDHWVLALLRCQRRQRTRPCEREVHFLYTQRSGRA
jgi:DNA-binding CsgD family transcriptional regulator